MRLARFLAMVDAYGGDPERWPAGERDAALILARSSLDAARALASARTTDALLQSASDRGIDDQAGLAALRSCIIARAVPQAKNWVVRWLGFDIGPAQLWPSLAGLALASVLGFGVGVGGVLESESARDFEFAGGLTAVDSPFGAQ